MNDLEQIKTIRTQALAVIREITVNPKPSYTLDSQRVSWESYLKQLSATVTWCDTQLASHEPYEFHTQGGT